MFRRSLAAVVVLFVVASLVVAGSYTGVITKISKDEVTIKVRKNKKDKDGEEKKFKIGKDAKYYTQKAKGEPTDSTFEDVAKGVEGAKKGARATVETDGEGDKETVTKVTLKTGKKGK